LGFIISVVLLWPLWQGKLWIIDDHGIVAAHLTMEKNNRDVLSSFREVLSGTEAAKWGETGRYRTIYFLTYTLKTYLFGMNAGAWYLWHSFVFFASIVCIGLSIHYFFPPVFVLLGMLFFAALPCYVDILGRLGTSEVVGGFWTCVFIYGLARYVKRYAFAWPVMCLSVFMATGYKENFVLLLLPLTAVFVHDLLKKRLSVRQILFFLFPLGMACLVLGSVLFWVLKLPKPMDFYGQSLSLFARARVVFNFFYEGPRAVIIAAAFLLFYTCRCLAKDKMEDAGKTFAAMIVLSICILGNFVFYNGDTGLVSRYGYMEQLFLVTLFFVALFPLRRVLTDAWRDNALFRRHLLRWSWGLGLVSVLLILGLMRVNAFRAARTQEFDDFLNRLQSYDNVQVINLGQALSSYEPYPSLKTFAKAGRGAPKVYYFPYWAEPEDAFQKSLRDTLMRDAALNPAPPLTPNTALIEFGPNGWFRFIEHSSPRRDIEQTVLMSGWRENIGYLGKFLGKTAAKGRRSLGERMALALPVDKIQAYKIVVDAVPFDTGDAESSVVFYCNGSEVKRTKLNDYSGGFAFEVPEEVVRNSPLHLNLIQLEARIDNADLEHLNGLTFYSIDALPLP
jgi:hypothetical protein